MTAYKKIAVLENQIQAQRLEEILLQEEVPHVIGSYHDSAYDGLFQAGRGWGYVEADAEHEVYILEILKSL